MAASTELDTAISQVTIEVNDFLATLPNLGDALDIQTTLSPVDKYEQNIAYLVTVTYVETP